MSILGISLATFPRFFSPPSQSPRKNKKKEETPHNTINTYWLVHLFKWKTKRKVTQVANNSFNTMMSAWTSMFLFCDIVLACCISLLQNRIEHEVGLLEECRTARMIFLYLHCYMLDVLSGGGHLAHYPNSAIPSASAPVVVASAPPAASICPCVLKSDKKKKPFNRSKQQNDTKRTQSCRLWLFFSSTHYCHHCPTQAKCRPMRRTKGTSHCQCKKSHPKSAAIKPPWPNNKARS